VEIPEIGLFFIDKDYQVQFKPALKINLLPQSYGLKGFRFASLRSRKQLLTYQPNNMSESGNNKTIVITAISAAAVALIFMVITIFAKKDIIFNKGIQQASIINIEKDSEIEPDSLSFSQYKTQKSEEESIQKSNALSYFEPYNNYKYYIIVGSFASQQIAAQFVKELESDGFSPETIYEGGKYRVSIYSFKDKYEALKQLDFVRITNDKSAWLLKYLQE